MCQNESYFSNVLNRESEISFIGWIRLQQRLVAAAFPRWDFLLPSIQSTKISPTEITIVGGSRKRPRPLFWITALGFSIFHPSISDHLRNAM